MFQALTAFTPATYRDMLTHAESCYPEECVGALFTDGAKFVRTLPLENAALNRRVSFVVAAREYLRCERYAADNGLRLCGFYHSHPDGVACASASDAAQAPQGLWSFIVPVIAGLAASPRGAWYDLTP